MKALIEAELTKIQNEIDLLEDVRERLARILAVSEDVVTPKKRSYTRKKKVGLPEAKEVA
jgi:hypothetical protein